MSIGTYTTDKRKLKTMIYALDLGSSPQNSQKIATCHKLKTQKYILRNTPIAYKLKWAQLAANYVKPTHIIKQQS